METSGERSNSERPHGLLEVLALIEKVAHAENRTLHSDALMKMVAEQQFGRPLTEGRD